MNLPKIKNVLRFVASASLAVMLSAMLVGCGSTNSANDTVDTNTSTNSTTVDEGADEDDPSQKRYYEDGISGEISEVIVSDNHRFTGQHVNMKITGLEEFDKLESDAYTDAPADEGNVFVVLYMELTNNDGTDIYFSPEYCVFDVDGQPATTTMLFNEPHEGYETIFGKLVQTGNGYSYDKQGFMAIEVPKDWQNITFKYTGWRFDGLGNTIPVNLFTRDDLHSPE